MISVLHHNTKPSHGLNECESLQWFPKLVLTMIVRSIAFYLLLDNSGAKEY